MEGEGFNRRRPPLKLAGKHPFEAGRAKREKGSWEKWQDIVWNGRTTQGNQEKSKFFTSHRRPSRKQSRRRRKIAKTAALLLATERTRLPQIRGGVKWGKTKMISSWRGRAEVGELKSGRETTMVKKGSVSRVFEKREGLLVLLKKKRKLRHCLVYIF